MIFSFFIFLFLLLLIFLCVRVFIDGFRSLDCSALLCAAIAVLVAFACAATATTFAAADCNILCVCVCAVCTAILLMQYVFLLYLFVRVNTTGSVHFTSLYLKLLLFNFCHLLLFVDLMCCTLLMFFPLRHSPRTMLNSNV